VNNMKILLLVLISLKRKLKDYKYLLTTIVLPVAMIVGLNYISGDNSSTGNMNIAINIEDKGQYGEEIIKELGINNDVFMNSEEEAMLLLEKNEVVAVYVIPSDFTEKINKGVIPRIQSYKLEEGNKSEYFEYVLNKKINDKIKERILIDKKIIEEKEELAKNLVEVNIPKKEEDKVSNELYLTFLLLIYFIMMGATNIATELFQLKKQKVLTRILTTANKGYQIIGSIYLYTFIIQIMTDFAIIFLCKMILKLNIESLSTVLIIIVLANMVSISLGIFASRVTKNQGMVSMVVMVVSVLSICLAAAGLMGEQSDKIPSIIVNLSKLTPIYWAMKSLETGSVFPGAFILILLALVLFTAGNFRLKEFSR